MTDTTELKKQFDFYLKNQDELVGKYLNNVLLIHGGKVVKAFENKTEAYVYGRENFEPGTFLIIKCTPGDQEYTVNYRTVNRFSRMVTA